MRRKQFINKLTGGSAALLLMSDTILAQAPAQQPAPLPFDLVKEFVIAGHHDLPKTQSMVKDHPTLIYSKVDWGNGDFEAAIEGAGHMGNKDIANFLIDAGSRVTVYVLTMLGRTDLVKPILEAYPRLITAKGPHGLSLLHHAKVGGKDAEELYAWLVSKGQTEDHYNL